MAEWVVPNEAVKVQRLGIGHVRIWNWARSCRPVRRHKPTVLRGIVPRAEIVQAGFAVAFLAGEFVILRTSIDERGDFGAVGNFAAVWIEVLVVAWCRLAPLHDLA